MERGDSVVALDNFITGSRQNLGQLEGNPRFKFIECDVTGAISVDGKFEHVWHLASLASPIHYLAKPLETLESGSTGTRNMLAIAHRDGARFLLTSTSECYGDPKEHPQVETYWGNVNPIGPRSCYDESKRYAEAMTMAYHRRYGVRTNIARIFNTYGPRMALNDGRVVPAFIDQSLRGLPMTIFGDGKQTRSFCYVDDLVEGLLRLSVSDEREPVNLGNPLELTMLEFAERIKRLTGSNGELSFNPLPTDDPKQRQPDISKAKRALGWEPKVELEDGLRQTIEYFKPSPHVQNRRERERWKKAQRRDGQAGLHHAGSAAVRGYRTLMLFLILRTLVMVATEQNWTVVPATIVDVQQKTSTRGTFRVAVTYEYVFQGQTYTGHRVSLYTADNFGNFYQQAFATLLDYHDRQKTFPAHVNPKNPSEAVLMPVLRWEAIGFYLVFALVFGGAGWGIGIKAWLRYRTARQEAILVQQHPGEPWKQRVAWATPHIESTKAADAVTESCIAIMWNAAMFPVLIVVPREVADGNHFALTFLILPAAGAALIWWALVALARARRFRGTYLELESTPAQPGTELRGTIHVPKALAESRKVSLSLRCESDDIATDPESDAEAAWSAESTAPVILDQAKGEATIAIAIPIPARLPHSSRVAGKHVAWLLSANAKLTGADFSAEFEVPVFKI